MGELKTEAIRRGNYLICPECDGLCEYNPYQKRFYCLNKYCNWEDEKEANPGDYNLLTRRFKNSK